MARYYNKSSASVPVTLVDGTFTSIGPRNWQDIPDGKDGSSSVSMLVKKGVLVRSPVDLVPSPPPATKKTSKKKRAPKAVEVPPEAQESKTTPSVTDKKPERPKRRRGRPRKSPIKADGE